MVITPTLTVNGPVLDNRSDQFLNQLVYRASGLLLLVLSMFVAIQAQVVTSSTADEPYLVEGVSDTMAYGLGRSIKITGTVKNGAIALGGDVIVQGTVEGDVAAIGGSVIQLEGSRIGGDVIVIGGAYRHGNEVPNRSASSATILYAGYEQELRNMMRNPTEMVTPQWSAQYIGLRILAVLFWFVVSLALTVAMPGTISQGIARLQLTTIRVAIIGFVAAAIIGAGVPFAPLFSSRSQRTYRVAGPIADHSRRPFWAGCHLCRHRPLAAAQVSADWQEFGIDCALAGNLVLGSPFITSLYLATRRWCDDRHQPRSRPHCPISYRLGSIPTRFDRFSPLKS